MQRAAELAHDLAYDLCVLTRIIADGPTAIGGPAYEGVAALCDALRGDIYAVLGNHDSIAMVPDLEALGIRMLLNECIAIDRGGALIYLAGVDDAHFYRADNIEKAAAESPLQVGDDGLHVFDEPTSIDAGQHLRLHCQPRLSLGRDLPIMTSRPVVESIASVSRHLPDAALTGLT